MDFYFVSYLLYISFQTKNVLHKILLMTLLD